MTSETNDSVMMKVASDGSTASYYELPEGAKELQDIISYKNMNSQIGEIFRACMRYGEVAHSDMMRDAKKIKFYIEAEIERLQKYHTPLRIRDTLPKMAPQDNDLYKYAVDNNIIRGTSEPGESK